MVTIPRRLCLAFLAVSVIGCGAPGEEHEDLRRSAYTNYGEGVAAFESNDRARALQKLSAALEGGGLNPDAACDARVKLAVCLASAGKHDEALDTLEMVGAGASNPDAVEAARSYIYKKQGKAAESRAALAKARQYNPRVQEFKD
jgi:predicted negative regulator of RcsB-dependent stress response